ncbi:hypothetical protein J0M44_26195 [Pseudomonas aeruginosa]|uniref:hypothetical protein n=1 Tax=Pseudomonas aeruginosa TaxID=287 RepID=UPI0019D4AC5E|nr:hypothetical protein [Pseudomonas aeruginosa]MBN7869936.1 hypothetical protein [Pseudomonas aeruginosa]MDG3683028.1 hypothetical protein [Pseudomonas aeruginosa]MDG3733052.1 hypothetical protein [Pseudomonas aeruginosa]
MARKPLSRTLQLKPVQFSKERTGQENSLVRLMHQLSDMCPTVGQRMWTRSLTLEDGTVVPQYCYFFNNYQRLDELTCIFEVWSFEPGVMPVSMVPDPLQANAVIDLSQWDEDGSDGRELIHISHVLVYGKAAIVECTRGTGGVNAIQSYLNKLVRDLGLSTNNRFYFTDAVSSSLQGEIRRGGGATGFTLGLSSAVANTTNPLLGMLSSAKNYMPNSGLVTVGWKSKTQLSTDAVVAAYNDAQNQSEIDSVIIHLKDGSSIRSLSKFKIKSNIEVEDIGGKNPNRDELFRKMLVYLEELLEPADQHGRVLDQTGALADNEIFIPNSRRNKERNAGE